MPIHKSHRQLIKTQLHRIPYIEYLINYLSLQSMWKILSTRKVFILVKDKHRSLEMRFNLCLVYLESLDKTCTELTDDHTEVCGVAGDSFLFCNISCTTLRHGVWKQLITALSDKMRKTILLTVQNLQNHNFTRDPGHYHTRAWEVLVTLGATMHFTRRLDSSHTILALEKCLLRQVQPCALRKD